jgi:hypothetical protein
VQASKGAARPPATEAEGSGMGSGRWGAAQAPKSGRGVKGAALTEPGRDLKIKCGCFFAKLTCFLV